MTPTFNNLMNGLDEVEAFLAGQTAGYKVSVSTGKADAAPRRLKDGSSGKPSNRADSRS
jgi:hypothetical protein